MQYEPPFGLHRAAKIDGHFPQVGLVEGNVELIKHLTHGQAHRAINYDSQGTVLVVFTQISKRAGKNAFLHGGHGNQKMMSQIEIRHADIVAPHACAHNLNYARKNSKDELKIDGVTFLKLE